MPKLIDLPPFEDDGHEPKGNDYNVVSIGKNKNKDPAWPDTWRPKSLATFMSEKVEAPKWLIPKIVPAGQIILVSGQQKKTCKSFISMTAALAIATGKGQSLLRSSEPGSVLYFLEEGGRAETKNRFSALYAGANITRKDLKNFHLTFHDRIKLDQIGWQRRITAAVQFYRPKLIVFDSLFKMHNLDENVSADMNKILNFIADLRSIYDSSIMILLHLNKQYENKRNMDIDSQMRGSGVLSNVYDTHLAFRNYGEIGDTVELQIRQRDGGEYKFELDWTFENITLKDDTELLKKVTVEVRDLKPKPKKKASQLVVGEQYTRTQLRKILGAKPKQVTSYVEDMIAKGDFTKVGEGTYLYSPGTYLKGAK